jgi:hypothetical protein
MNIKQLSIVSFALASIVAPLVTLAQGTSPDPSSAVITASPVFKAFLDSYVFAINSKDREKLKACLHPKSLAILAQNQPYADLWFKNRFSNTIPAKPRVSVTAIAADAALPFAEFGVVFPVRPTQQAEISFETAPDKGTIVVVFLALEEGKWLEVVPSAPAKK